MSIKELLNILFDVLTQYLTNKTFTGKIIFTVHCRCGGAAKCTTSIEESFYKQNSCTFPEKELSYGK